ncbi:MAG TPA: DUF4159 domain-containing protein [Verrucomicrobiae bacterium]|nr:DUF4159 domain-containing protein [Verrucomicrobiae bacterium]
MHSRHNLNKTCLAWIAAALVSAGICVAQFPPRSGFDENRSSGNLVRIEGGAVVDEDKVRTARETLSHSSETPGWTNAPGFERDVFTFTRMIFQSDAPRGSRRGFGRRLGWWVDYPDADLNLSYRLQQLTSIRTDPDARVLKLTDPDLFNHPLLYLEHAGYMQLSDDEVRALRRYLAAGGALFVNDFWSEPEWEGFASEIRRVVPDQHWIDLELDHPVFHCVFDLRGPMHHLRVPTIQFWNPDFNPADAHSPPHRMFRGPGSEEMHVRALLDGAGRIMILAIHNSDVSDGWEREGENDLYFSRFSEKIAYPLGINMVFYLMTH